MSDSGSRLISICTPHSHRSCGGFCSESVLSVALGQIPVSLARSAAPAFPIRTHP